MDTDAPIEATDEPDNQVTSYNPPTNEMPTTIEEIEAMEAEVESIERAAVARKRAAISQAALDARLQVALSRKRKAEALTQDPMRPWCDTPPHEPAPGKHTEAEKPLR